MKEVVRYTEALKKKNVLTLAERRKTRGIA
jgi:hypothetical protein